MGMLHRLLWRRPQSYRRYRAARKRREGYAARYAAERGRPSFQATVTLPDGTGHTCVHEHRTEDAARVCGKRIAREVAGPRRYIVSGGERFYTD